MIVGYFSIPHFGNPSITDNKNSAISIFLSYVGLQQINTVVNSRGRLLDLVLTDFPHVSLARDDVPLVDEDPYHPNIQLLLSLTCITSPTLSSNTTARVYNFRKADYVNIYNTILNTNWSYIENYNDIDDAYTSFYNVLYNSFTLYVPLKSNTTYHYTVWFTREHICDIKLKNHYHSQYRGTKSPYDLNIFKELRRKIKVNSKLLFDSYASDLQSSITTNPKKFWQFVRTAKSDTGAPGSITSTKGELLEQPLAIVNAFQ
ncbi:hypothetical protein QE152_g24310 [Popillia japonica]|uniref:Uncharacterized protein n=1 Tax=Popillia japonica TaxID=7064 RepID=A0AAW1KFR0_POPJA